MPSPKQSSSRKGQVLTRSASREVKKHTSLYSLFGFFYFYISKERLLMNADVLNSKRCLIGKYLQNAFIRYFGAGEGNRICVC